ncbi:hypothetical protein [Oscillibacter valericigenes]|uniref:hypothetical protein n=1 Tax=Oscillibacter valericigenes TaxID=351091 RepID=UPI0038B3D1BB
MEKKFIRVDEVAKELEISESHAYKIMRKLNRELPFITTDKILISIHRTAIIIWVIKIIRTAGTISPKQNCLMCKSLQRVGVTSSASSDSIERRPI